MKLNRAIQLSIVALAMANVPLSMSADGSLRGGFRDLEDTEMDADMDLFDDSNSTIPGSNSTASDVVVVVVDRPQAPPIVTPERPLLHVSNLHHTGANIQRPTTGSTKFSLPGSGIIAAF
uniref:Subtilisin n=1 Tax=Pseudo-nitzschia australis TaxID=44445 RepID=A0A7S4AWW2_9STRA|mmetsp:Transcript_10185/g.20422  ORF Transcript_10185/g.20422 Transcript_10185/m.20422 type:complete len:120 (+) Transcript_10185:124-483(+)